MEEKEVVFVSNVTFYYYSKSVHRVTIPKKIVDELNLNHGDIVKLKLSVVSRSHDGYAA